MCHTWSHNIIKMDILVMYRTRISAGTKVCELEAALELAKKEKDKADEEIAGLKNMKDIERNELVAERTRLAGEEDNIKKEMVFFQEELEKIEMKLTGVKRQLIEVDIKIDENHKDLVNHSLNEEIVRAAIKRCREE